MTLVSERGVHPEDVVLVPRIVCGVELRSIDVLRETSEETYQFKDSHFHLTLVQVRWLVLDHLDSKELVRAHVLTLDDLAKCTLAEHVQDQVPLNQLLLTVKQEQLTYRHPVHHQGHH